MMHLALSSWIPFFLLLAVLSLNFVKKWSKKRSSDHEMRNNLPPGPPKLPIIGNMHQLMGSLPHHSLKSLAEKHGDLMHLMLGEIPTIVASSPRAAEAILKTNDTAFADRPGFLAGEILFYGCSDMTFAPYGEYWRQMRKISTLGFLSIRVVRSFSLIRQDEISKLVTSIREESGPEAVNLTQKVSKYTSLMVCRAALGREFGRHQDKMMELLQEVLENTTGFDVSDIFPSWRILPYISRAKPKLVELKNKIDAIFDVIIQEHVENQMEKNGEFGQEDLVDVLLRIQQSGDQKFPVTYANIKAIFMNIFLGGTDTSVVVVEWAMAEMIRNPRVLAKVQSEIRELLPTGTVAIEEALIAPHKMCLVRKFSYGCPKMEEVREEFKKIGFKGSFFLGLMNPCHVLIRFELEEDYQHCWLSSIWNIAGYQMPILKWRPGFKFEEDPPSVPIWVSLHELPLEWTNPRVLYSIATAVGKPLQIDTPTLNLTRALVACFCVEVDLTKELPKSIRITPENVASNEVLSEAPTQSRARAAEEFSVNPNSVSMNSNHCILLNVSNSFANLFVKPFKNISVAPQRNLRDELSSSEEMHWQIIPYDDLQIGRSSFSDDEGDDPRSRLSNEEKDDALIHES
ncbi:OLC1v1008257C2 [Oldenlandia corymbosa var. corymbosa]|uniref:OLC1v1008257C2 n=1 Tax=Oldenlandia corymbosa var. corymbosa TaxID=529605 RepID=A0AAV1DNM0_OLDCO|nr:OLC1v1008257C2 [Oldenlandia corymbosa var. corymbosa]